MSDAMAAAWNVFAGSQMYFCGTESCCSSAYCVQYILLAQNNVEATLLHLSGHGRRHCPSKYRKCRIGQTRNWFLTPGPIACYRVHLSWVSSLCLLLVHMSKHVNGTLRSLQKSSHCIFSPTVYPISLYFHFLAGTRLHQFCLRTISIRNRIR
jgi:hypothetical protein